MKKIFLKVVVLLVCFVFTGQFAQAENENSIRLSLGVVPGVDEVEFSGSGGVATASLSDDTGGNFSLSLVHRNNVEKPVGFVIAAGLFTKTHTGTDVVGDEVKLQAIGFSLAPGLALKVAERGHLELKVEGGIGSASQELTGFTDGSGPYYYLGFNVGGYYNINEVVSLGADVGYMNFTSDGEVSILGGVADSKFTGSGPTANISLSFIF